MAASDPALSAQAYGSQGYDVGGREMYLRASLMRKGVALRHFREDYPTRAGAPAWIQLDNHNGKVRLKVKNVPIEDYPFKPHRYYMDDFDYPDQPRSETSIRETESFYA